MVRIEGVILPQNKRIEYALRYIFGIGLTRSRDILTEAKINYDTRVKDLRDDEVKKIQDQVEKYTVEGALRKEITLNIKRLQETGSYRGSRHKRGLPVRGQRTKTNARTRKGPRANPVALAKKTTKK